LSARAVDRGAICRGDFRSSGAALSEQVRAPSEDRRLKVIELFRVAQGVRDQGKSIVKPPLTG
jgi:hypothetical protein